MSKSQTSNFIDVWQFPGSSPDGNDLMNYNNSVDMSVAGNYEITYQLNDSSGNLSENLPDMLKLQILGNLLLRDMVQRLFMLTCNLLRMESPGTQI